VTSADKRNAIERASGQQVGHKLPTKAADPQILVEERSSGREDSNLAAGKLLGEAKQRLRTISSGYPVDESRLIPAGPCLCGFLGNGCLPEFGCGLALRSPVCGRSREPERALNLRALALQLGFGRPPLARSSE
jgi:hypothetical protein